MAEIPTLTAADILALRRRYNHPQEEGDCPLGIEYLGAHGYAIEYFWCKPGSGLTQDGRLEGRKPDSVKIFQLNEGGWQVQLRPVGTQEPLLYHIEKPEIDRILAEGGERLYAAVPEGQEWHDTEG